MVHIPNFITLARVILVPIAIWLIINDGYAGAFVVFLAAGISDAIDGFLAKRFGWQTELGAYLDPLADKLLLVSVFVALGIKGGLPSWIVIAVVTRDILIVIGVVLAWLLARPFRVRPYKLSKANTAAQIVLAAFSLATAAFALDYPMLKTGLIWTAGFLTIASLIAYLNAWLRHLAGYDTPFRL